MAHTASEVTLRTPTIRTPRPGPTPGKEGIPTISHVREPARPQREWHAIYAADR